MGFKWSSTHLYPFSSVFNGVVRAPRWSKSLNVHSHLFVILYFMHAILKDILQIWDNKKSFKTKYGWKKCGKLNLGKVSTFTRDALLYQCWLHLLEMFNLLKLYILRDWLLSSCHSNVSEFNRLTFNLLSVGTEDTYRNWSKGWAYMELPPGFATLCTEMYQRPLAAPLPQAFCSQQQYHRHISAWIWPRNGLIQHKENCLCKATVHHKRVSAGKLNVHCVESQHHTENNTHWGHYAVQSLHTYKTGKLFLWPTSSVLTICPNIPDTCCKKSSTKA